jgi:hypothetical protein
MTNPTQTLDIAPENKKYARLIAEMERQRVRTLAMIEQLREEIAEFQREYDTFIGPLDQRLKELEEQLFKFSNIDENVDTLFSFSEAEKAFDDAKREQQSRVEEEFRRQYKKRINSRLNSMSKTDRAELKRIYWKLAHLFHPDMKAGNERLMMAINKAYAEANLQALYDFAEELIPKETKTNTLDDLKLRLTHLTQAVEDAKGEINILKRSRMYVLKCKSIKSGETKKRFLENLAGVITCEISIKRRELNKLKEKMDQPIAPLHKPL